MTRHSTALLTAGIVGTVGVLGTLVAPAVVAEQSHRPDHASTHSRASDGADPALQRRLDRLVAKNGMPGVVASVRGRDGTVRTYTAGKGNLRTGAPMPRHGHVRIASNTKMFTATVVLQLVAEGKVDLEAPVEKYLPGVVRGHGNDGRTITVRELLQQTSGLPDYDTIVVDAGGNLQSVAHTYFEPRRLVDAALAEKQHFSPGTKWEYSNTNYVLLGLLAERVTGRPYGEEVTHRVIDRIGLKHTYWPQTGEQELRGSHPHGYWGDKAGAPWEDITRMDPSLGWSAGQLVSTTQDLGRFMQALLGGRLLPAAQVAEMRKTVAAPGFEPDSGWRYGLGLASHPLSCGGRAWGHGGDIQGFETRNLVTDDGRWAVIAFNALPTSLKALAQLNKAVDAAVCGA